MRRILKQILTIENGIYRLMVELLYGTGMRLMECCRLCVKDIDFSRNQIVVREGKGDKDRAVPLPRKCRDRLRKQVEAVRALHANDRAAGFGAVWLPFALREKYPNAERELAWKWLFPSQRISRDPRDPDAPPRRHHIHENSLQKAMKRAVDASGIQKPASCHTLRHRFATHLLEAGHDIRTVQELPGHNEVQTTMIYTHVMESGPLGVRSPVDMMW